MFRRHARSALCLALTFLGPEIGQRIRGAEAPLSNEDVVRMVIAGRAEEEILRVIEASPVDFDLDPEVLKEMRHVGVSEGVITAMRRRMRVASSPPPPAAASPAPTGTVELLFFPTDSRGKRGASASFQVIRRTPAWAARRMGMPIGQEVEDLALFVACSTSEHVPDHWSDRTPLKDSPRHELLAFHRENRPGKTKGFEVLSLVVPPRLTVEIPPGSHSLVVGIAVKVGSDWQRIVSDTRQEVQVEVGRVTRVEVKMSGRIAGSSLTGFRPQQELTIGAVEAPEDGR